MNTYHDLIRLWGGPKVFASDLGITESAAQQMSHRNNIHSKHWPRIVARSHLVGLEGVTYELLASLSSGRETKHTGKFGGKRGNPGGWPKGRPRGPRKVKSA